MCPDLKELALFALKKIYSHYESRELEQQQKKFRATSSTGFLAEMFKKINSAQKKDEIREYLESAPEDIKILEFWKVNFHFYLF